ncbi:hypothetical protein H2202_000329 [Exophiala xenobiotica]|nr:hypothetical protein H2202_000329 [Exophiala xenobiotica]KAK5211715.1 hypothetical protein LTR41_003176 [Exophiala xenobiotica]KAK5237046.1 hypothetical protein LTR47_002224 [Exophiala xenobiotica]KAK5297392.1 hypothetical protein LTR14_003123 [Exophiala xenobiotica]KAK5328614.1 hypothetical protein LTR93_002399 [Exophiala xenobiotica]
MEQLEADSLARLPNAMLKFVIEHATSSETAARLGQLTAHGRPTINTPHYIAPTSRGVIPHLSHDNLQKHTRISAVYVPLEDFIEKSHENAPVYTTPTQEGESPLRRYIGLPIQCLSIFGPRRVPSIAPPAHNTNSSVAISTSVGFRFLDLEQYNDARKRLKADISISLADVIQRQNASLKRVHRSADRSHAWLRDSVEGGGTQSSLPFFASVPPLEPQPLSLMFRDLHDEYREQISGLCLYSPSTTAGLPDNLRQLPVLCLSDPATPHAVLAGVHAGVDMMTVPFVTQSSEHGIALSFSFPGLKEQSIKPLGTDMWSTAHATDLSPLSPDCNCYTCQRHHRAYVHHLLQASEMLAWTLLQIHNYTIIDSFFDSIRESIKQGTFVADMDSFCRAYEPELPKQTGQGPRVRGYQTKSVGGGEMRKNPKVYGKLDDQIQKLAEAESGVATPDGDANEIEEHGLAKRVE